MVLASSNACRFFRSSGEEIVFAGGSGAMVRDTEGREYVDFILGCGPVVLGHADKDFAQRFAERMQEAIHLPGYTVRHHDLAAQVLDLAGPGKAVGFFKHSSDSMTAAARLSSNSTGRLGVIRCGYLGWHDLLMGQSPGWHEPLNSPFRPLIRPTGPMRGIGEDEPIFNWIDLDIETLAAELRARPDTYAAFMIDAHQRSFTTRQTLEAAFELCRRYGVQVVVDETKTAGRVSPLGMLFTENLVGDYLVLGKAIANGAPLSILVGPQSMTADYATAKISGTHCKELLGIFAAEITRDIMAERDGYAVLPQVGSKFEAAFNEAAGSVGVANEVGAEAILGGGLFEIRFSQRLVDTLPARQALVRHLADSGVLLMQAHPSFFSLAHDRLDWGRLTQSVADGLRAWLPSVETMAA